MDERPATTAQAPASAAPAAPLQVPGNGEPVDAGAQAKSPGFRARGGVRRRARFLRKARELAYRDLGGLVFSLHRFGQRNDALVIAKLTTLGQIDAELRALEAALGENRPVTILREAGITACPRCAAIHSADDRFCPRCGLSVSARDLPIGSAPATQTIAADSPAEPTHAPAADTSSGAQPGPPGRAPVGDRVAAGRGITAARVSAPSPAPAPEPAPAPASPARARRPATRKPAAPAKGPSAVPGNDEPTEIIRPPAAGA